MLYHLLYPFHTQLSVLNVTRYITFRTAAATLSALAISLAFGPWLIRKLREFQIGQVIRTEGPQSHRPKAGTPTMGGLLILTAALVPTLLWADLTNVFVWIAVLTTAGYGAIGFADDYLKIVRRSHHGLLPRYKMGFQILIGVTVGVVLLILQHQGVYNTRVVFPFFKRLIPDLGYGYLLFAVVLCGLGYAEGGALSRELGGARTVCWALVVSLPVTIPVSLYTADFSRATPVVWLSFAYVALVSMFLGFFAWYAGLAAGGVAKIGQIQLAQPVLTLIWSALVLGEPVGWPAMATAAVVLVCVVLTQRSRVPQTTAVEAQPVR